MGNFKIKQEESKIVGTATFNKADDYKVVELNGKSKLLHKIHADKLISKGLAKVIKTEKVTSSTPNITVTPLHK